MVRIYTRTGDEGKTSLFGGDPVSKGHHRLEAYGTLDELNAVLGWFRSKNDQRDLGEIIQGIQTFLFDLGAHLATPPEAEKAQGVLPPLTKERVDHLEGAIDKLEEEVEPLTTFILPGGTEAASILHMARAVCRRAERAVVRAEEMEGSPLHPVALAYLNRLSDLLFVMARVANRRANRAEPRWEPERPSG